MILGLDIGANSVGWCLVDHADGTPASIIAAGVRCFAAGVEGDLDKGREESRSVKRRQARLMRRQTWRRQRRQRNLFRLLQRNDLLPRTAALDPTSIHECLRALDASIRESDPDCGTHRGQQTVLYRLRARAVRGRVSPHELGRALYHLAQHRGYLSNRRSPASEKDEDRSQVLSSIRSLAEEISASGQETLGAYLATIDPDSQRIRGRWTSRQMHLDEFDAIWAEQQKHLGSLTAQLRREIHSAIFFQRPLKDQSHLIGRCEFEKLERRARIADYSYQRFRMLQVVNNLRAEFPDRQTRPLGPQERTDLLSDLEECGDRSIAKVRGLLGFPKATVLSIEHGGEKKLPGNRTSAAFRKIFGDRWDDLTEAERQQVLVDVLTFEKEDALRRRAERKWKLPAGAAGELSKLALEDGYASLSTKAITRLLPHLEAGLSYSESVKKEYPSAFAAGKEFASLPPVRSEDAFPELRNPTVLRSLSEVRGVVNAIVARYGKPSVVRIELARDLKRGRLQRQAIWKRSREREKERSDASEAITKQLRISNPQRRDVEKVLLAHECGWRCPYTGRQISMADLIGDNAMFDIEHIIPFSRSLDDSFLNKTLCLHEENRNVKRNRTPFEAYGASDKWDEILARVRSFRGSAARMKLERFLLEDVADELNDEFTSRHLNDTRYASTLAAEYVGRLFGGVVDATGTRRVQVSTGALTAFLRGRWELNKLLDDGGNKTRTDHRHHAVDALVVALTDAAAVRRLNDAAKRGGEAGHRLFSRVEPPWDGFVDQARAVVERIVVSHRVNHRLNGSLHEETLYGRKRESIQPTRGTPRETRVIRKHLSQLEPGDLEKIVDAGIQRRVEAQLTTLAQRDPRMSVPKFAFADAANHPVIESASGRRTPIHAVRIAVSVTAVAIGSGPTLRHVKPGSNHHMAIVADLASDGSDERWRGVIVSRLEAIERHRSGSKIVRTECEPGARFVFSIASGDSVRLSLDDGKRQVCLVRTVSGSQVEMTMVSDARVAKDIRKGGKAAGRLRFGVEDLRRRNCEKVSVDRMGEVAVMRD